MRVSVVRVLKRTVVNSVDTLKNQDESMRCVQWSVQECKVRVCGDKLALRRTAVDSLNP